jgi:lipid A 3-O-deacylase
MRLFTHWVSIGTILAVAAVAAEPAPPRPWETRALSVESGVLWEIGSDTPFPYRLPETQLSWKSAATSARIFGDGSRVVLRHRFTLLGAFVQQGPESRYIALSASPSIEWWNAAGTWSLFAGSGGGFGLIDSQGITGGQGQDFTLNWLIRGGMEHAISSHQWISAGFMYQHMSNGGRTNPNPGINALGFMLGYSWKP